MRKASAWVRGWSPADGGFGPPVDESRGRMDDGLRDRVVGCLSAGVSVVGSNARVPDPLSGRGVPVVPVGWRTDGVWLWDDAVTYFARFYGIRPDEGLMAHLAGNGFVPRVPSEVELGMAREQFDAARRGGR